MPNSKYIKGVALEREVVNAFKKAGCQSWRSAGSHGPYDVQVLAKNIDQVIKGWQQVYCRKFNYGADQTTRVGKKYTDVLYVREFKDSNSLSKEVVVLIQCKRKGN